MRTGETPWFEFAVPDSAGRWHIYVAIYRGPLRVYAFGRWWIGRPW